MGPVRRWIIRLLLRDDLARIEREIEEEFRFHIDMKAASLRAQGMDPEDARALALDRFGDLESLRQAGVRDLSGARSGERRASHMDWMGQDLRDACRQWVRRPGFALLAAGTLALGLAASTAVFTYVNAYSQPFPGADARDLYQLFLTSEQAPFGNLSYPDYLDLTATGVGSVPADPVLVGEDDGGFGFGPVVVGGETPAHGHLHAHQPEKIPGDALAEHHLGEGLVAYAGGEE
ncbi:permease prefix domain 1-containing protein, partial [Gemmatimonadota bacterium]